MKAKEANTVLGLQLGWITAAESKVPAIFAIDTAMLGVVAALIGSANCFTTISALSLGLTILALTTAVGCLAMAMFPRTQGPNGSSIFFGGIAVQERSSFVEEFREMEDEKYLEDLLSQVHRNAEIAELKFSWVKRSFIATFLGLPFWATSVFLMYK